ncbi:MAG: formylglycine-generating enzyme family protein [Cyanobacteria bacterium P01_E01_bin.34]
MAASSEPVARNLNLYTYRRTNKAYVEDLGEGVKLRLMLIPSGEFVMGAPESETESQDSERPQHRVEVRQFLMGCTPVTQAQWRVVAGYELVESDLELNPSRFNGDNRPVEQVSWDEAQEFCRRLSLKSGKEYCLPSEAQWEYACRAGTETPFHFGETISFDSANYDSRYLYGVGSKVEYRGETTNVALLPANDWGMYDMHGNVLEWCEDDWHVNYEGAPTDGSVWVDSSSYEAGKLLRGGSWYSFPGNCRSAYRNRHSRDDAFNGVGFRVCCVPPRILLSS